MTHRLFSVPFHRIIRVLPVLLLINSAQCSNSKGNNKSTCTNGCHRRNINLASTISSPNHPTTIFIHGLDSSKETWSGVLNFMTASGYPAIAIDLRGHGESPVGLLNDFSSKSLSDDILDIIDEMNLNNPVVIVGHSMGGRIVVDLLASEAEAVRSGRPRRIASAVIEDIDVHTREGPNENLSTSELELLKNFSPEGGRIWSNWELLYNSLLPWYEASRIEAWRGSRVRQMPSGEWWSDVSPWVQRLARRNILATADASLAWDRLAVASAASPNSVLPFAVHLWIAGSEGTVCAWEGEDGVLDMKRRLPEVIVREFTSANHSIHNSEQEEFMTALKKVIDDCTL